MGGAVFAITFLTILPLRVRDGHAGAAWAPAWFPLVGAGIGGAAGAMFALAEPGLGGSVAAVLALVVLVVLTGGLHQDGLADCADGLGVRGDRERRLGVMRDPANGTFGTLALVLWALLMVAALAPLDVGDAVRALVAAAAIGRTAALLHARTAPPARADGLGSGFAPATPAVLAAVLAATAVALALDPATGAAALLAGGAVAAAMSGWSRWTLGGRTGDTLGATVVLTEAVVLLVWLGAATP